MGTDDLRTAAYHFYTALNAVFDGDTGPMSEAWSHAPDVTYMSPFGQLLVGWAAAEASWHEQAEGIDRGTVMPEDLHLFRSDTLGVVVGMERGTVVIGGQENVVSIRATTTYRLEDGAWKVIGHHTDRL